MSRDIMPLTLLTLLAPPAPLRQAACPLATFLDGPDLPETNLRIPSVRCPKWALLPCVLAVLIAASASSQQTRVIHADMAKVTGPHSEVPLRVVGAGRAEEGLRADWQGQLAVVQSEIGFKYLRMHGLLCDDMGVYTEDRQGNPQFNFQYVDTLYDALLKQHIRPFVELSFMPGKLASGTKTVFWWKGNVTPPKDPAKWGDADSRAAGALERALWRG
jgi:hypothetical protein